MIYMVTNINMKSYWNPNTWECYMEGKWNPNAWEFLVSQECLSRVPHVNLIWIEKNFILKLEKNLKFGMSNFISLSRQAAF